MRKPPAPWLIVLLAACAATACTRSRDVVWNVRFQPATLGSTALRVEASIHDGASCTGPERYRVEVTLGGPVPMPADPLPSGTYAFCARALDASCNWYADGYTVVDTRTAGSTIEVAMTMSVPPVAACPGACVSGTCPTPDGGPVDAGSIDGGTRDAGTDLGCTPLVAVALAAGGDHTCAEQAITGDLYCWGANESGQVGVAAGADVLRPVHVALPNPVNGLGLGTSHTCASTMEVPPDGGFFGPVSVTCWGAGAHGQLGSPGASGPTPQLVVGAGGVDFLTRIGVPSGGDSSCAIAADGGMGFGQIVCWGANGSGQLGNGSTVDATHATASSYAFPGLAGTLALGARHGCIAGNPVVSGTPSVQCAGDNSTGALGRTGAPTMPADVALPSAPAFLGALAAGNGHTCLVVDGALVCWGANDHGQLGIGSVGATAPPTALGDAGTGSTTAVAAGDGFTCATVETSMPDAGVHTAVLCWGDGSEGQNGSSTSPQTRPAVVPTLSSDTAFGMSTLLAAGRAHACATVAMGATGPGRVVCWGANAHGQLGTGTSGASSSVPLPVCL